MFTAFSVKPASFLAHNLASTAVSLTLSDHHRASRLGRAVLAVFIYDRLSSHYRLKSGEILPTGGEFAQ